MNPATPSVEDIHAAATAPPVEPAAGPTVTVAANDSDIAAIITPHIEPAPHAPAANTTPPSANANTPAAAPMAANDIPPFMPFSGMTPPHTHTESTLAPTSEFARSVLTIWGVRYLPRGLLHAFLDPASEEATGIFGNARRWINHAFGTPGRWLEKKFPHSGHEGHFAMAYSAALGFGSLWLTLNYSWMVYKDIKNIFCETVGAEFGKSPEQVTFNDIRHSENRIIKRTIENFNKKLLGRIGVDILFFPTVWLRNDHLGDAVLGGKALQLFMETWKRKTTMFEDLVTFVNNKINPRNGLGQPIVVGEIFDLYQHYEQEFHPDRAFTNVLERGTGEGARWATAEPIFRRITELMNQTYAYKHPSIIDPQTGHAVRQANFALPTFIYLLGNDLIDLQHPERTQIYVEIANRNGIDGVKAMQQMLQQQTQLAEIIAHFHVQIPEALHPNAPSAAPKNENGVIIKGSSVQLDQASHHPRTHIDAQSITRHTPQHIGPALG